jgi:prepilin-type N-terminal cleavage/methylation domain-containing protein
LKHTTTKGKNNKESKMKDTKGFTLIELIMVTIILGILAAVAIPRYMTSVAAAEAAAEDAVISSIRAGLENYATEQLMSGGRRTWPTNPFDALDTTPSGYSASDSDDADTDGEWTFNTTNNNITHQRDDNTRYHWDYDKGTQSGDNAAVGSLGARESGVN